MSRLLRTFRDVLPPRRALWWFALPSWVVAWMATAWATKPDEIHLPLLGLLGVSYGLWRALGQHPALPGHRAWLEQTPWRPGTRLPLGPVRLVWQDAVILGVAAAPALAAETWPAVQALGLVFLLSYSLALGGTFLATQVPRASYPLAFALGGLCLAGDHVGAALAVTAGMALWTQLCLSSSLAGFPWRGDGQPQVKLGGAYPFDQLHHDVRPPSIAWYDALALSALSGWWLYVSEHTYHWLGQEAAVILPLMAVACFGRLVVYLHQVAAPISVLGRLRTGRLLIPGFDKVFVVPTLAFVAAAAITIVAPDLGASSALTAATSGGIGLAILLLGGPNLEAWRLTGYLRIAPPLQQLQAQQAREQQARRQRVST